MKINVIILALTVLTLSYATAKENSKKSDNEEFHSVTLDTEHAFQLKYNVGMDKLGIKGYSPVSYLEKQQAEKGNVKYRVDYQGITYLMTSEEQVNKFIKNPDKYLPNYGGYCALGVKYGKKLDVNPLAFKIIDEELYLFKKDKKANALAAWEKQGNDAKKIEIANGKWEVLQLMNQ